MKKQYFEVDHQGQMIRGMQYLPGDGTQGPYPTLMMMHGFTGHRFEAGSLFLHVAEAVVNAGCAVVTFDFINSGDSDGSFEKMLPTDEIADAVFMTEWLKKQDHFDSTRLGLMGFSLGGMVAACTVGRTDAYKSLIMVSAAKPEIMLKLLDGIGDVCGPFKLHSQLREDIMKHDPMNDCCKNPRRTLLLQGTEDAAVCPKTMDEYLEKMLEAGIEAKGYKIQGGTHAYDTLETRGELISQIVKHAKDTIICDKCLA